MGYEYTVYGWLKAHEAADLGKWFERLRPRVSAASKHQIEHAPHWFTVSGDRGHYLSFATESKYAHITYLEYLSLLLPEIGRCTGLVTITGEWLVDGRGQFVIVEDRALRSMPLGHLIDVESPWHALYRAIHYMSRKELRMQPPGDVPLDAALAGRDSVKAWFLWRYDSERRDLAATAEPYVKRWDARVAASVGFQTQYGHDCMVLAQDGVDAGSLVRQLAAMSADFPESWGMLYASDASERVQQPVAVQNGKVSLLPEVRLRGVEDPLLVPYDVAGAYAGLGKGYAKVCVKWEGELDALAQQIGAALGAAPGSLRRRERSDIGSPLYLMDVEHRTWVLLRNEEQDHRPPPPGYAYVLFVFSDHAAHPDALRPAAASAAERLRAGGIDVWRDG